MRYANGDVFEGQWANDMKNGPGVYYYADGAVYEGVWQEDIAKCGCYRQATESEEQQPGALPALQLENAQLVLADAEDSLPPMVYYWEPVLLQRSIVAGNAAMQWVSKYFQPANNQRCNPRNYDYVSADAMHVIYGW